MSSKLESLREELRTADPASGLTETIRNYLRAMDQEREYLVAAYLAETGLHPSEVEIVESREGGITRWWVRPRSADPAQPPPED